MFVVRIMPMIGEIARGQRLNSLSRCHAITEKEMLFRLDKGKHQSLPGLVHFAAEFDEVVGMAIKQMMLEDRVSALDGKMSFIIEMEVL